MRRIAVILTLAAAWMCVVVAQQGPSRQTGETVARPKAKEADKPAEPQKIPSQFGKQPELPEGVPTFRSDVITVSLDVAVLDNRGRFIPGIPRGNFRVLEDNVPQQIRTFEVGESGMTVCLLIEFSNLFQSYWSATWAQTLTAAYTFVEGLKPDDYLAVVAYDIRPEILSDFSTDRREAMDAMRRLNFAAYSEANLFDAVTDTADRMSGIEGRKAIVLLSSGIDTFSKKTFGEARKALQSYGVPVYAVGLMQAIRIYADAYGMLSPMASLDFLQADNQLRTFANETGGQAFFPRFEAEFPGIFRQIANSLRNQYSITYQPSNQTRDGKFRRIKVELVDPQTNKPLRVVDENKKTINYKIITKNGYYAPRPVE